MYIELDEHYTILTDPYQYVLEYYVNGREHLRDLPKKRWNSSRTYYSSLNSACLGILKREIHASEAASVKELLEEIAKIKEWLISILDIENIHSDPTDDVII